MSLIGELGGKSTSDTLQGSVFMLRGRIKSPKNEVCVLLFNTIQTALAERKRSRLSIAEKASKDKVDFL